MSAAAIGVPATVAMAAEPVSGGRYIARVLFIREAVRAGHAGRWG